MIKRLFLRQQQKALLLVGALLSLTLVAASTGVFLYTRAQHAQAAASSNLNFQMRLLNASGTVVPDGNYNVEFKLYDSLNSGGSAQGVCSLNSSTDDCWWVETRTGGNKVRVVNGYLTVNLGSVTPFGASIPWNQQLYITVNIGGTGTPTWDGEMVDTLNSNARMSVTSVPYAFQAQALAATSGSTTNTLSFATPSGSNHSITIPNASGTLAVSASGNIALDSAGNLTLTGQVPIASGGTNASTSQGAINNISQLTTEGDLLFYDGANSTRLARGNDGDCLTSNASSILWGGCGGSNTVLAQMYDGTGGTDLNQSSPVAVPFDTHNRIDAGITHSAVTNNTRIYLDAAGWYKVSYMISGANQSANRNNIYCRLRANGSTYNNPSGSYSYARDTTNAYSTNTSTNVIQTTSSNEYIEVMCGQAGSAGAQLANANESWIVIEKIGGSGTIDPGVTIVGALDGGTANADGATIAGSNIYLQSASGSNPGVVNTTTQTFAGDKTFSGNTVFNGTATFNAATALSIGTNNITTGASTIQSTELDLLDGKNAALVDLNDAVNTAITGVGTISTGVWQGSAVGAQYGGTGQSSYAVGDLLYANTTSSLAKLADVALGSCLISGGVGAAPSWGACGGGATTVGTFSNTATADALDIAGSTITLHAADSTHPGAVSVTTQSFGGDKTFTGNLAVDGSTTLTGQVNIGVSDANGTLLVLDTKNTGTDPAGTDGAMYYNSNAGKFRCYEAGTWVDCIGGGSNATASFTSGLANAASNTTGQTAEMVVATNTTAFSLVAGATGFTAPASGSFRSCLIKNNANITAGTLSVRWTVNGSSTGSAVCNMDSTAAKRRQAASALSSGVVTFSSGDTIGLAIDTNSSYAPATADYIVYWTVEYNVGGGGGGGSSLSVGTIDSQTKSADGAVISGSNLVLQTADASSPGLVSTTTQTFAGDKSFNGAVAIGTASAPSYDLEVQGTANSTVAYFGASSAGTAELQVEGNNAPGWITVGRSGGPQLQIYSNHGSCIGALSDSSSGDNFLSFAHCSGGGSTLGGVGVGPAFAAGGDIFAALHVKPVDAADEAVIIQGLSSQTADLLQIQDNASADLVRVTASGDLVVGSDVLHVDNAGGKVGVGLSNPEGQLQVSGSVASGVVRTIIQNTNATSPEAELVLGEGNSTNNTLDGFRLNYNGSSNNLLLKPFTSDGAGTTILTVNRDDYGFTYNLADVGDFAIQDSGTNALRVMASGGYVRVGSAGSAGTASGNGDLYVQDALEVDGEAVLTTVSGAGLSSCSNGTTDKLLWNNSTKVFSCGTDQGGAGGGVTTVGTFSGSSQTNGANITGSTITFGPADATNPGMVTTGAQTFAGAKTFANSLKVTNSTDAEAYINSGASDTSTLWLGSTSSPNDGAIVFDNSTQTMSFLTNGVYMLQQYNNGTLKTGAAWAGGKLQLVEDDGAGGTDTVTVASGDVSSSYTLTLPGAPGSTGDCLKAADSSGTLAFGACTDSQRIVKASDETVTGSTSLQDDDELSFSIGANETWIIQVDYNYTTNSAASNDIRVAINNSATGASCTYAATDIAHAGNAGAGSNSCNTAIVVATTNSGNKGGVVTGSVSSGGGSGTVTFRWAQGTNDGTNGTTVKAGSALLAFKVSGADLAEIYNTNDASLTPGSVVQFDPSLKAGVKSADASGRQNLAGIVATNPGSVLADADNRQGYPVPVTLVGRVPVRVNDEHGPIQPGDLLTASQTPGVATKAIQAGYVIGRALEGFSGSGEGKILVFANTHYAVPDGAESLEASRQDQIYGQAIDSLKSTVAGLQDAVSMLGGASLTQRLILNKPLDAQELNVIGKASVADLEVRGEAIIRQLKVSGDTLIEGNLTVIGLARVGTLEVNGHLISKGGAPSVEMSAHMLTKGLIVGVDGTDSIGTISVTTGDSVVSANDLARLLFTAPYSRAPHVLLVPANLPARQVGIYSEQNAVTATGFDLRLDGELQPRTTYMFNYYAGESQP